MARYIDNSTLSRRTIDNGSDHFAPEGSLSIYMDPSFSANAEGRFNNLSLAIVYAQTFSPSAITPVVIYANSGAYFLSQSITFPPNVHLVGLSDPNATKFFLTTSLPGNIALLNLDPGTILKYAAFFLNGNSDYGLTLNASNNLLLVQWCNFFDPRIAHVYMNQGNQFILVEIFCFWTTVIPGTVAAYLLDSASLLMDFCVVIDFAGNANLTGLKMINSLGNISAVSRTTFQFLTTCIDLNNSNADIQNMEFQYSTTGFNITNQSLVISSNVTFFNIVTEVNQDATSHYFGNNSLHDINKLVVGDLTKFQLQYPERNYDNGEATKILGSLAVGTIQYPANIYLGQGTFFNNSTVFILKSVDQVTFTDVSALLRTTSQSTVTVFDNLSTSALYVGANTKFACVQFNILTAATGGGITAEYWGGSTWVMFPVMTVSSTIPFTSKGYSLFRSASEREEVRFDNAILTASAWALTTLHSQTKYWVRFRITSALSASATINHALIIGNSAFIFSNGGNIRFGLSRPKRTITWDTSQFRNAQGQTNPGNQDIYGSNQLIVGRSINEFKSAGSGAGAIFTLPTDIDTSTGLELRVGFVSSSSTASQANFQMTITLANVRIGDPIYLTQPVTVHPREQSFVLTLTPNATNGTFLNFASQVFYLISAIPTPANGLTEEMIMINLNRTDVTNANSLVICSLALSYYSFRDGYYSY